MTSHYYIKRSSPMSMKIVVFKHNPQAHTAIQLSSLAQI